MPESAGGTDIIWSLVLLDHGQKASSSQDHTIKIWNPISGECEKVIDCISNVISLALLLNGQLAVGFGIDVSTIQLWS